MSSQEDVTESQTNYSLPSKDDKNDLNSPDLEEIVLKDPLVIESSADLDQSPSSAPMEEAQAPINLTLETSALSPGVETLITTGETSMIASASGAGTSEGGRSIHTYSDRVKTERSYTPINDSTPTTQSQTLSSIQNVFDDSQKIAYVGLCYIIMFQYKKQRLGKFRKALSSFEKWSVEFMEKIFVYLDVLPAGIF